MIAVAVILTSKRLRSLRDVSGVVLLDLGKTSPVIHVNYQSTGMIGTPSEGKDILLRGLLLKKLDMFPGFSHRGFGLDEGTIGLSLCGLGGENPFTGSYDGWVFRVSVK